MEKIKALLRNIIKEELDGDLNELARISEKVKIGDKAKAEKIKKLYANAGAFKWIADIIEVIEKAGDAGIARMDAIDALHKEYKQNKTQQEINPKLKDLIDSGVLLSAGLSQPKAEKNVGGAKGRPTSEKTQIARQVDAKLQADKEYQATPDELDALGAEFIEKLRKRVKGELKRGRPSKPKDVMENQKKTLDYKLIFQLIDLSNAPTEPKSSISPENIKKVKDAEEKLIRMGIYNSDGEFISKDKKINKYYLNNWS